MLQLEAKAIKEQGTPVQPLTRLSAVQHEIGIHRKKIERLKAGLPEEDHADL